MRRQLVAITATSALLKLSVVAFVALLALFDFACAQTFEGYECTVDCSGHEAGYEWAERNGISDADDCSGNSNSFIEGCRAWADQQTDEDEVEDSSSDDDAE